MHMTHPSSNHPECTLKVFVGFRAAEKAHHEPLQGVRLMCVHVFEIGCSLRIDLFWLCEPKGFSDTSVFLRHREL